MVWGLLPVSTYLATFRAAFEAETEGVAEVTAERMSMALEEILGEEDEEGAPSYKLQLTEVLKFDSATTFVELADLCCQLRNKLIYTKRKPALEAAGVLDELAHQLRSAQDPDVAARGIIPPYDRARMLELMIAVWAGENPVN